MANFKRKHPRRQVRCALCTPHRLGNSHRDGTQLGTKAHTDFQAAKRGAPDIRDPKVLKKLKADLTKAQEEVHQTEDKLRAAMVVPLEKLMEPLMARRPGEETIRLLMGLPGDMNALARKLMPMEPLPKNLGPVFYNKDVFFKPGPRMIPLKIVEDES